MSLIGFFAYMILTTSINVAEYDFPVLFNKDKSILRIEHFVGDTLTLKEFDKFTKISVSEFVHSSKILNRHRIDKWSSEKQKLSITKVKSTIVLDTVIYENNLNGKKDNPKEFTGKFEFCTYRFDNTVTHKQMLYTTIIGFGVDSYLIGNEKYSISYESVPVGLSEIYMKAKLEINEILERE